MDRNPFTDDEISGRLARVRAALAQRELDAAIFASPESVFYLTGLDHWGYFAPHLLIVPLDGKPNLVTRSMEKVTDAAAGAAIAAISDGAAEQDVAAECVAAMIRAGGHAPGFGPFIRPAARLGEEHTTWGSGVYRKGEPVFVELSGCVSRYHAP